MIPRWLAVLALTALPTVPARAAVTVADALGEARRLIDVELRFKEAIEVLEGALAEPRVTREERVEAYRLLGIAYVARGAPEAAEQAFAALLQLEPSFELDPLLSPKIQRVFARVKARTVRAPRIVDLTAVRAARSVEFSARVEDEDGRLARVVLHVRGGGEEIYQAHEMERGADRVTASVPAPHASDGGWTRLEYYVAGEDAAGATIARVSDAANPSAVLAEAPRPPPVVVPPPPPIVEETPWYGTWWFWTIAAGVVGASAAIIVISRSGGEPPSGTLDPIEL